MSEWQTITLVLSNSTSVSTTFTGSADYASITNYVQQNCMKGFWVGNTFYPGSQILSVTIS
jgi:hypothetical protein